VVPVCVSTKLAPLVVNVRILPSTVRAKAVAEPTSCPSAVVLPLRGEAVPGPEDRDGCAADGVVHDVNLFEYVEWIGGHSVLAGHGQDARKQWQRSRGLRCVIEEGRGVDVVVARIGVLPVGPVEAGVAREHQSMWMVRLELAPRNDGGQAGQQLSAGQVADNGLPDSLLPPGFGLPVVHQQIAVAQAAGGAEIQHAAMNRALEVEYAIAERTGGDDEGHATDGVVNDLVPDDDLDGIGPRVGANLDQNDRFDGLEPGTCCGHTDELGGINGRDLVFDRPAEMMSL
jgi:hypothetical protein